jgi:hypothetical protein
MGSPLEALVFAATRAPSGDNTQPWRFVVDETAKRIDVELDESRDLSPMNSGQRMARIAIGAAVETLLRTARDNGWEARLEDPPDPATIASVRLFGEVPATVAISQTVAARTTNRRVYDGRQLPSSVISRLGQEILAVSGVRAHWLVDLAQREALAEVVAAADALMFGLAIMRRAFLANVRFDAAPDAQVEEGLSLASLELSFLERLALRPIGSLPDWLFNYGGALRGFKAKARKLMTHSSGVCLVSASDDEAATDVSVGRVVQKAWLSLTELGLAAQPMMSLPVLHNFVQYDACLDQYVLLRDQVAHLVQSFRAAAPVVGDGRPAFLLRFGYAPPPSGRVGRRSAAKVCQTTRLDPIILT